MAHPLTVKLYPKFSFAFILNRNSVYLLTYFMIIGPNRERHLLC